MAAPVRAEIVTALLLCHVGGIARADAAVCRFLRAVQMQVGVTAAWRRAEASMCMSWLGMFRALPPP